ncbi:MAG: PEGA domain-containing protein [Candidatus Omnitrophica bacterium]|nr:PEGA domain-containing protein [Candidatus Omnitrophota bacterium]
MKKLFSMLMVFAMLCVNSGCATLVGGGSSEKVQIQSEPRGAEVFVDGISSGKTPVFVSLERRDSHQLKFKKEGYAEETRMTTKGTNGWLWGNLLVGGIIGILIDMSTGAAYKVDPKNIHVVLTQVKASANEVVSLSQEKVIPVPTNIDQIEKLGKLRDAGYVTENEFMQTKSKLLESSQAMKSPVQAVSASQVSQPVSNAIVQAGAKADLALVTTSATDAVAQNQAQTDQKLPGEAPLPTTSTTVPAQR